MGKAAKVFTKAHAFTKGPWEADLADEDAFDGVFVRASWRAKHWVPVAIVPVDFNDRDEREANARLIAAAPDLYAALKLALCEIHNPGASRACGTDVLEIIDAALSKATNSTP